MAIKLHIIHKSTKFSSNYNNSSKDSVFYWNLNNTTSNSNTNKSSQLYSLCLMYIRENSNTQDIVSYDTKIILSYCLSRDIEKSIINKINKQSCIYNNSIKQRESL